MSEQKKQKVVGFTLVVLALLLVFGSIGLFSDQFESDNPAVAGVKHLHAAKQADDLDVALSHSNEAYKLCAKVADWQCGIEALIVRAKTFQGLNQEKLAEEQLKYAWRLASGKQDLLLQAAAVAGLSEFYLLKNKDASALKAAVKAANFYDKAGNSEKAADTLMMVANKSQRSDVRLNAITKSVSYYSRAQNKYALAHSFQMMGETLESKDKSRAYAAYQKAASLYGNLQEDKQVSTILQRQASLGLFN